MSLITSDKLTKEQHREDYIMSVVNVHRAKVTIREIYPNLAHKYAGDFYGLLLELNVRRVNFGTVLRLNGLKSSSDFNGMIYNVKVLDES